MGYQAVFKRYELKYLLTTQQKDAVLKAMVPYMSLDKYGRTTIRNVYYDTDSFLLIRRSIEKPVYKEKLRVRSYDRAADGKPVFVELKKKYKGIVYKRRLALPEEEAFAWLSLGQSSRNDGQIWREIDYFAKHYSPLSPKVFLSYEREAFYENNGGDFRVTFDNNIMGRTDSLTLGAEPGGTKLLDDGKYLMEIKTAGGIPLWMTKVLCDNEIFKTSFSKYGTFYRNEIFPKAKGGFLYA